MCVCVGGAGYVKKFIYDGDLRAELFPDLDNLTLICLSRRAIWNLNDRKGCERSI